jgi:hypothetical protein
LDTIGIIGIIGFSFALSKKEPNPCNRKIAREIKRLMEEEQEKGNKVVIVAQEEIAKAFEEEMGLCLLHIVSSEEKVYLDSNMVMSEAAKIFRNYGINKVIPVANPFLHLQMCWQLVRKSGFHLIIKKIKWVGFCKDSLQWWTRNPLFLIFYTVRLLLFGKRG